MQKFRLNRYAAIAVLILTGVSFSACNHAPIQSSSSNISSNENIVEHDSLMARNCIVSFLNWYRTNLNKANNWTLLGKDVAGNFIVDTVAYANYLNYINSSGFVSPKYIDKWREYFVQKGIELKQNKVKEDVPDGFDFDLVLITQEPELVLDKIDGMQFNYISLSDTTATIGMKLPTNDSIDYEFELAKEQNAWHIVYISTANYD